jgi:hypothetical protein
MLQRTSDRFNNPVGDAIRRETDRSFDALLEGSPDPLSSDLFEDTVKIRSVQDFSPSQAVGFVFLLKQAIRERVADQLQENGVMTELLALESRIDELALQVFDAYTRCRKKIHEIRTSELKNHIALLQQCLGPVQDSTSVRQRRAARSEGVTER